MYDVLVYVYENYYTPASCPQPEDLFRDLAAAGFEHEDIHDAMSWLHRLAVITESLKEETQIAFSDKATRVYGSYELYKLGIEGIHFLSSLESSGALTPSMREAILNCALDAPQSTLDLSEFKILALMVMWSQELEVHHALLEEFLVRQHEDKLSH
ncbi:MULTISPECIES: DUF494 family protein [Oligella]|uniref:Protein Smg homolog n=1 Tax=Oligella urethralis DNF00040 TaxID=1401065 RepID=A0A096BAE2_9BURK|nr:MULTISPECIES: DUF494 domain-containing protein [Oligella]KGF30159.1 hypothetical protein HMPREF2130_07765 [Oligella urethralis DNF00040]MDK6202210.1 DUF494 domain-containing protein [Oligella urethralis]OFS87017.1 hypothetical protein HMPREF3144_04145 [Oligella sp. HMSC05A10]OFV50746.1 hypothetical protein HMPREF3179_02120 [Oligella sp. HMSC09E12]PMC15747.1 DUF494 domain-containing protein [Oligella urethralis]